MIKRQFGKLLFKFKKIIFDQNHIAKGIVIGDNSDIRGSIFSGTVHIEKNCRIVGADISGNVKIGKYTSIWGPNIFLRSALNPIIIGNFCSIARNVTIQEYNHNYKNFTTYFLEQNFLKSDKHKTEIVSKGAIIIENDVWIGANCVVLSGSHISTGAIIAAGSVVNGYIPPYAIAGGSPAKVVKYRFSDSVIKALLDTEWWNLNDEKLREKLASLKLIVE